VHFILTASAIQIAHSIWIFKLGPYWFKSSAGRLKSSIEMKDSVRLCKRKICFRNNSQVTWDIHVQNTGRSPAIMS